MVILAGLHAVSLPARIPTGAPTSATCNCDEHCACAACPVHHPAAAAAAAAAAGMACCSECDADVGTPAGDAKVCCDEAAALEPSSGRAPAAAATPAGHAVMNCGACSGPGSPPGAAPSVAYYEVPAICAFATNLVPTGAPDARARRPAGTPTRAFDPPPRLPA